MSELRSWWGADAKGQPIILVAKTPLEASKLAGVTPGSLPFGFRQWSGSLPYGVGKPGLYRNVGGAWVRDQSTKAPPDLED